MALYHIQNRNQRSCHSLLAFSDQNPNLALSTSLIFAYSVIKVTLASLLLCKHAQHTTASQPFGHVLSASIPLFPHTLHGLSSHLLWDYYCNIIFSVRLALILTQK